MYVCNNIYVRAAAYSLDCHGCAIVNHKLYRTFQSSIERRTESVRSYIARCVVTLIRRLQLRYNFDFRVMPIPDGGKVFDDKCINLDTMSHFTDGRTDGRSDGENC